MSANRCVKCGACLDACPALREAGPLSFPGPRRLAIEAPRQCAPVAREELDMCTSCSACSAACPARMELTEAVLRARRSVPSVSEGTARMLASIDATGRSVRPTRPPEALPRTGDTLFFPGCVMAERVQFGMMASLSLLRAAGARPYVPEKWSCCGAPLEKAGERGRLAALREANAALLESADVVTSCPGCAARLEQGCGIPAQHMAERLAENASRMRFNKSGRPVRVSLQKPCHLVRSVGPHAMDDVRQLLQMVPGVTVVDHAGDGDCCGGGGGAAAASPVVSQAMARRRMASAKEARCDLVIAPCPFCAVNLSKAGGIGVRELAPFLASRLEASQAPIGPSRPRPLAKGRP